MTTRRTRKRFDERTRAELKARFLDAYRETRPQPRTELDTKLDTKFELHEAEVFVRHFEGLASPEQLPEPEKQQRRRERVEAFANALDTLIQAARGMDDSALTYALSRGVAKAFGEEAQALNWGEIQEQVLHWQKVGGPEAAQFALGVRTAIKELPALDKDYSSFERRIARYLEDYLSTQGIPFTTSDTGLAGKTFLAVMDLAGRPSKSASNWLRLAQKSPKSFANWIKSLRLRFLH